jgi:hypothetical protein
MIIGAAPVDAADPMIAKSATNGLGTRAMNVAEESGVAIREPGGVISGRDHDLGLGTVGIRVAGEAE